MSEPVIQVRNISKAYRLGRADLSVRSFREAVMDTVMSPIRRLRDLREIGDGDAEAFWALRDVSFDIQQGEVVGLIGRNGAGKSTLLKVLSRITEPTSGRVKLRGRVGSLLEVGTGFHPELTGRENVYLNGAILGMRKKEIDRKFDEIIAFAEIEQFLDTPVKRYSSGMYVRLAFAVAAHLDPEILIVDEVLAVGDAQFQKKCLGKMGEVAQGGRTVVFVSHQMAAVQGLCSRAVCIEGGRIINDGATSEVVPRYLTDRQANTLHVDLAERQDRTGTGRVRLTSYHLEDGAGNPIETIASGQDAVFVLGYEAPRPLAGAAIDVGISIQDQFDNLLFVLYSSYTGETFDAVSQRGSFTCSIPRFPIAHGRYVVGARIFVNSDEADWPRDGIAELDVVGGDFYGSGHSGFEGRAPLLVVGSWGQRAAE